MRKIPKLYVLGLFLPVLLVARAALADAAADLKQAEELYEAGQYERAEQAYQSVLSKADPGKPEEVELALQARKKLPLVYVATDRLPQARQAVRQLLDMHAQDESLPHAIHEIVESAKPLYRVYQIGQVFQDVLAARPADSQAIWLKMGMAIAAVHLGDKPAVDGMLQNITAQHASDKWAAEVLNHVAWAHRKLQEHNSALEIYEYVVDNWPDKPRAAFAQHGIVICHLGFRNPREADAALAVLLQRFGEDENASKLTLWAAHDYFNAGEIERACNVYELLVENYPDTEEAIQAQAGLAVASVQAEDRDRIETAIQSLLTRFPANEVKAIGLHDVANTLAWKLVAYKGRPAEGADIAILYKECLLAIANYTLANWPSSDWAMWAQRDLATVAVDSGDEAAAEAAIDRLTGDYANRKDTPAALYFLGNLYQEKRRTNKAEILYQHLVHKYPEHELMSVTKARIGQIKIRQGDEEAAEAIFQMAMTEYANHRNLPEAVHLMAEGYYRPASALNHVADEGANSAPGALSEEAKTHVRKAIAKWDVIIEQLPAHPQATPASYYYTATAYCQLRDYPKAVQYCRQLVDGWPDHDHAWKAQFLIAKIYKRQMGEGRIPDAEGMAAMNDAFDGLLAKYPGCPAASGARKWMQRYGSSSEGGQK